MFIGTGVVCGVDSTLWFTSSFSSLFHGLNEICSIETVLFSDFSLELFWIVLFDSVFFWEWVGFYVFFEIGFKIALTQQLHSNQPRHLQHWLYHQPNLFSFWISLTWFCFDHFVKLLKLHTQGKKYFVQCILNNEYLLKILFKPKVSEKNPFRI